MWWLALGVVVPVLTAVTWWRADRWTAAVVAALLLAAGLVSAGLVGRIAVGDFCSGLMIGLPLLVAQAVRAGRLARSAR